MNLKQYYGAKGKYLKEHEDYFSNKQLKNDVSFITDVLKLKKSDKVLDLACGHGRHTIELAKKGFDIDGLDFSKHLIDLAKSEANKQRLSVYFYVQNIHAINLNKKYNKIFLFFSEFGLFDAEKVFRNVRKILKKDGQFLLDTDNVFRLINYLKKHPKSHYHLDVEKMELFNRREKSKQGVRYYTVPEIKALCLKSGFNVLSVFGNYNKEKININSKRIILLLQKK